MWFRTHLTIGSDLVQRSGGRRGERLPRCSRFLASRLDTSSARKMPPPNAHKISSSGHELYHEALKFASLYVYLSIGYGTLLLGAALQVAGVPVGFLLGLQDAPLGKPPAEGGSSYGGLTRSGALSLATAGVMGLLIGLMVSTPRCLLSYTTRGFRPGYESPDTVHSARNCNSLVLFPYPHMTVPPPSVSRGH